MVDDEEGEQAVEHAATAVNTDRAPPRSARPGLAVEKFGGRFVILDPLFDYSPVLRSLPVHLVTQNGSFKAEGEGRRG